MSKFIHEIYEIYEVITRFKEFNLTLILGDYGQKNRKSKEISVGNTSKKSGGNWVSLSVSILKYRAGGTRSRGVGGIQGPKFWLNKKQKKNLYYRLPPLQILDFPPTLSLIFYEIVLEYLNTVIINFKDHHNSVALNTACPTRIWA